MSQLSKVLNQTRSDLIRATGGEKPVLNPTLETIDMVLRNAQDVCRDSGYSLAGCRILIALHRDAPLRVTEIAAVVGITQQAVGKHLRWLSIAGILIINRDDSDGRAKLVDLTSDGLAVIASLERSWK